MRARDIESKRSEIERQTELGSQRVERAGKTKQRGM